MNGPFTLAQNMNTFMNKHLLYILGETDAVAKLYIYIMKLFLSKLNVQ